MPRATGSFRARLWTAVLSAALLIVVVSAARLTYRNYQMTQDIDRVAHEIAKLTEEKKELEQSLASLGDFANIEKEAREKLNLKREGEKVVILLPSGEEEIKTEETTGTVPQREPSNPEKWWKYLFANSANEP